MNKIALGKQIAAIQMMPGFLQKLCVSMELSCNEGNVVFSLLKFLTHYALKIMNLKNFS